MIKKLHILILLYFIFISCTKEKEQVLPQPEPIESIENTIAFEFKEINNSNLLKSDVVCQIHDNQINGNIPYRLASDSLVATFSIPAGYSITVNNVVQESGITKNDFSKPVNYLLTTPKGLTKQFTVGLKSFTGLPIMYITTTNNKNINSKDDYINAHLKINGNTMYNQGLYNGEIQIRGRGNSTWTMPKKPFKIKLNNKAQLLDMPADKEWVLLANYSDKTLMRNYLSFELSRRLGLKYTPRSRFVEVYINNIYEGNYLLTEQIKIAKDRIDIKELSNNDVSTDLITGGYLLEVDTRLDADFWFKTKQGLPFCIKSPENVATVQYNYIKNYVQQTEDVLYSENFTDPKEGYAKYINIDSFINWYLLNEITKNHDAAFYSSVYLYKDRNGKLNIGPAWDFDIAIGNINYDDNDNPEGFWILKFGWINRLFQDPVFSAKVKERFNLLKDTNFYTLNSYIDQTSNNLNMSQIENFNRWKILNENVWPNAVVLGSYDKEVEYIKMWLGKRLSWLNNEYNQVL